MHLFFFLRVFGFHFPKSSIILLLFWACWTSCSALDISIISRRRWKVRSREMGGSSDRRPRSTESPPSSFSKPPRRLPALPCKSRRVSCSFSARFKSPLAPRGYMDDGGKEFESPLPNRMKYSSPRRSRMGPEGDLCCCCCCCCCSTC